MTTLIKNARIYTCAGPFIPEGDILLEGGKISAVGVGLTAPEGAEIIDARGLVALPGLVDAHSHVGSWHTMAEDDDNEMISAVTPDVEVYFGINPDEHYFKAQRMGGITTACCSPGSGNVICGMSLILKTVEGGMEKKVMKNHVALKGAMGQKRGSVDRPNYPMTRMGTASVIKIAFRKAKEYMEKKERGEEVQYDQGLENMCRVLRREIPFKVHTYNNDNITVAELCRDLNIYYTIDHAFGSELDTKCFKNDLCKGVIFGPIGSCRRLSGVQEITGAVVTDKAGILTAIMTDGPHFGPDRMIWQAGECVRAGGDLQRVLNMITINAAKMIGVDDRVGSLEPGKDADVVLFSAVPALDTTARVVRTIINGETVYKE